MRWCEELTRGGARTALIVGGLDPAPTGAHHAATDVELVLVAGPDVALVMAAQRGAPLATWAHGVDAVRAAVPHVDLPPGSRAVLAQALQGAPSTGGVVLAPLLAGLGAAVDHERAALAARLHDGPVQDLTAAQLLLDSVLWGEIPPDLRSTLEQSLVALRSAITASRELMATLAPGRPAGDP